MKVNMQTIVLAALTISSVLCLTIPSSFEKTVVLLEQTNQEQQSQAYDGGLLPSDSDRGHPVVASTIIRDDDDLSADEKTLALAATVYDNLAPLVQLAGALPDKKPTEGITKMKSGYSRVITTTVAARQQGESSDSSSAVDSSSTDAATAVVVEDIPSETPPASEGGIGKSIEKSKESGVVVGGGANQYRAVEDEDEEDEEEVFDAETIVPGRGDLSQFSPSLSAKESLAIFMREHLYAGAQSAGGSQKVSSSQPMAAKYTINDDTSASAASSAAPEEEDPVREMERELANFVEKFMSGVLQAKMHNVRVEQRANGLQDYRTS